MRKGGLRARLTALRPALAHLRRDWPPLEPRDYEGAVGLTLEMAVEKVDEALVVTDRLSDALRSALEHVANQTSALQLREAQIARQAGENLEYRLMLVTSVLLVPTLVVSIYGANTALPGRDSWTGFVIMVGLIVLSIAASFAFFRALDRRERRSKERAPDETENP